MESMSDRERLTEQLRAAERGEVASWLSWRPSPWDGIVLAVWTGVFVLNNALSDGPGSIVVYLALTASVGLALWWQRRHVGTYPSGKQPRELMWPGIWSVGLFVAILVTGWGLAFSTPWWLVTPLTVLGVLATYEAYRRSFHRASTLVRRRLGIEGTDR